MKLFYTLVLLTVFVLLFFKDLPVSLHLLLSSFIMGSFFIWRKKYQTAPLLNIKKAIVLTSFFLLLFSLSSPFSIALTVIAMIGYMTDMFSSYQQYIFVANRESSASREIQKNNELFQALRAERHDFIKHVSAVSYLLETNQRQQAQEYIQDYVEALNDTHSYIQGEHSHVASVVHQSKNQAHTWGIHMNVQLDSPLSQLPLKHLDQMNLIMNLLHNALEAAHSSEKKEITVSSMIRSGIYILEVSNSTAPLSRERQDHLFTSFHVTEKKERHEGLGTWIISELVSNYHGRLEYTYHDLTLSIKIKFPIVVSSKQAT